MAKSTAKTQVEGTSINADIKEGKALGSIWKQTNSLKTTIKANGFDTRLGKLLQKLKAASSMDNGQISRQVLTVHGINIIDRRRRAEALWFVENEVEVRAFIESSGFKGSSLTALQAAMRKAAKAAEEPSEAATDEADNSEAEASNVGQSDSKPKIIVTKTLLVNTTLQQAEINNIDLEEIVTDLLRHLEEKEADRAMVKAAA